MPQQYDIYFDGCCEPRNPGGSMGIGVVVYDHQGKVVHEISYGCIVGENWHEPTSNNIAEYLAFLAGIKWLSQQEEYCVGNFYGDSKLVVCQMNGEWGIKEGLYTPYAKKAKEKLRENWKEKAIDYCIFWIPREKNEAADNLSKLALSSKGIQITDRTKK